VVRFSSGKNVEEVAGNFINEKEMWCETPSFEKHAAKKVEVTVSINKGDYTI
jgi:dynein heavy chain